MDLPRITVIDFETTGVVPGHRNEPWQIGCIEVTGGIPRRETLFGHWLHVGARPFNRYAPGRHAQRREELAQAPHLHDLWSSLAPRLLGRLLAAHHVATERSVLADAFPLHAFGPWIDTLTLARRAWPGLPSHALEDLIPQLGLSQAVEDVCPGLEPHDARHDAAAAAVLLAHLLRQPGWDSLTLEDLGRLLS